MESLRNKLLQMLNSGQIDGNLLSEIYYSKCNDKCVSKEEFQQYFPLFFQSQSQKVIESLIKEHNIVKIFNKIGELVKYT